ncbi:hypothetical protein B0H14DRAFT_3463022 [Mycena olivaceomarginata]|nr:hypothetical protein B0H14DRAFT_3463022 [Mycena olivaceomarginata]
MAAAPVAPAPAPKFSFKAPLPPSASASSSTSPSTSTSFNNINPNTTSGASAASQAPETETAPAAGKQRRVSLALPSSPRVVPAWHFRDDTSVPYADPDPADSASASAAGRKGKVRRIALEPDDDADAGELEGGERDASPSAGVDKTEKGEKQEAGTPTGKKPAPQVDAGGDADARGRV